jgi:hypothetical protein
LNIRTIYLYAVSFATLMMPIFGVVGLVQSVVEFAYPPPVWAPGPADHYYRIRDADPQMSPELIQEQIEHERENQEQMALHGRVTQVARNFALIGVALSIYLYHWRRVQQENRGAEIGTS